MTTDDKMARDDGERTKEERKKTWETGGICSQSPGGNDCALAPSAASFMDWGAKSKLDFHDAEFWLARSSEKYAGNL